MDLRLFLRLREDKRRIPLVSRPQIRVAAGVLQDSAGRFMAAQRPEGKIAAGKWEFPGGKIESGESPAQALVRELREELGIELRCFEPLIQISHAYTDRDVHMWVYRVSQWDGEIYAHDGQAFSWGTTAQLRRLDLLGADGPILRALELPSLLPLTPESDDIQALSRLAEQWCQRGLVLARLRLPDIDNSAYAEIYQQLVARHATRWLVDRSADLAIDLSAAGYHATAAMAAKLGGRPVPENMLFGVSCHDQASWDRARNLGADYALLSPVCPTPTHPEASELGWNQFEKIVGRGSLPTYALGGMRNTDLPAAREHWAQGISAIRAFS